MAASNTWPGGHSIGTQVGMLVHSKPFADGWQTMGWLESHGIVWGNAVPNSHWIVQVLVRLEKQGEVTRT